MKTFSAWLKEQMENRKWSLRELGRRTGLSHGLISGVLSDQLKPSADFCIKVAESLDHPPADVLTIAGILPPHPDSTDNPALKEANEILRKLHPDQLHQALGYLRYLRQQQKRDD